MNNGFNAAANQAEIARLIQHTSSPNYIRELNSKLDRIESKLDKLINELKR